MKKENNNFIDMEKTNYIVSMPVKEWNLKRFAQYDIDLVNWNGKDKRPELIDYVIFDKNNEMEMNGFVAVSNGRIAYNEDRTKALVEMQEYIINKGGRI